MGTMSLAEGGQGPRGLAYPVRGQPSRNRRRLLTVGSPDRPVNVSLETNDVASGGRSGQGGVRMTSIVVRNSVHWRV